MPIQRIAIIGAGSAGRAFALRCATAGFDVILEDVMPSNLRRAQDEYKELCVASGAGTLSYAMTVDDAVRSADIVIDFVPDELESKLEIFCMADRMAPPRAILCTPTDSLSITDLASCTYRAELCMAMRGTLTSPLPGPVDLVRSKDCAVSTVAAVSEFFVRMDVPFRVVDDMRASMDIVGAACKST